MKITRKDIDKAVVCVTAKSFPDGVSEAHQKLHSLFPRNGRSYYGISFMNHGEIVYKAAISMEQPDEAAKFNLETFVIKKGKYSEEVIEDFMSDISSIGRTFQVLLNNPQVDPNGYCLEEYFNDNDVRCLVKLQDD